MGLLGTLLNHDCNVMGDVVKISAHIPCTCVQNAIPSLLTIPIISIGQIYVAIDNPSLVPSASCLTACSYLWKYMRAAGDVSHTVNLQGNSYWCCSNLNIFRDRIQVTQVFRLCSECQD